MLTEGDDSAKATYALRQAPVLRREAESLLPALEAAKAPTSREAFAKIMVKQRVLFGLGDREIGEWSLIMEGFYEVLGEFSTPQIEEAFRRWHRGEGLSNPTMATLFPQPRQLYPLAQKAKSEIWIAAYRARKALEGTSEVHRELTPEERSQVSEGFQALVGSFRMKTIPEDMKPTRTPAEAAAQLRAMASESPDEDVVL